MAILRRLLIPCISLFIFSTSLAKLTEMQFRAKTNRHRQRVAILFIAAVHEFYPNYIKELGIDGLDTLSKFIGLHDQTKIMSLKELKGLGYKGTKTLGAQFAKYHGKSLKSLNETDQKELRQTILIHNKLEELNKKIFFGKHNIPRIMQIFLNWLEHIPDVVDTKQSASRRLELEIADFNKFAAQDWLLNDKNPVHRDQYKIRGAANVAQWLSESYPIILAEHFRQCLSLF